MRTIVVESGAASTKREPLNQQLLIETAVSIAQSEGLAAVTMRRLASATGKAPMTLYSHVPNKESLLVLIADAVLSKIAIPRGQWDEALAELCLSTWREMGKVPGLAPFVWAHVPYLPTPHGLRLADASLDLLRQGGFQPADAGRALESLMTYVTGDVERHQARRTPAPMPARQLKGYPNLQALRAAQGTRRHPAGDPEEDFSYGLALLIEGLRRDPRRRTAGVRMEAAR